jgi:hypothetical protein
MGSVDIQEGRPVVAPKSHLQYLTSHGNSPPSRCRTGPNFPRINYILSLTFKYISEIASSHHVSPWVPFRAELISTGKGGRYGGADMTPGDAASLLTSLLVVRASAVSLNNIALLTKSHLQDLTSHENSPSRWSRPIALPQLRRLKLGHTFGDAFSALIESISNGDMERAIKKWTLGRPHGTAPYFNLTVRVNNPSPNQEAAIGFVTSAFEQWMLYLRRRDKRTVAHPPSKWSDVDNSEIGLRVLATIQESELKAIGLLLRNSETTHA